MQPTYSSSRILQPVKSWFILMSLTLALLLNFLPTSAWLWMPDWVALILVFNLFDLLPNSPLTPMTWLLAGALLGHAESRTAVVLPYRRHLDTGADRRVDLLRIGDEVVRDLLLAGEGVGVDVELLTREAVVPRRPVGHQGIPPPGPPPFGDAVAFQHEVRHVVRTEMFAHRDPGLTRTDDENLDVLA